MPASSSVKKAANPGSLGLLGFGITTILFNLYNAGIVEFSIVIVATGLALGGAAQIVAGVNEFKVGKTFSGTAFAAYGFFWISFSLMQINPFEAKIPPADDVSMGYYLLLWGIFSLFMFFAALAHNVISRLIFLFVTALFFLLALSALIGYPSLRIIAAYTGILTGALALYSAGAQIVNGELSKKIFPL